MDIVGCDNYGGIDNPEKERKKEREREKLMLSS